MSQRPRRLSTGLGSSRAAAYERRSVALVAVLVAFVGGCSSGDEQESASVSSCELLSIGGDRVRELVVGGSAVESTGVLHLPGTVAADEQAVYADPSEAISTIESWTIASSQPVAQLTSDASARPWPPGEVAEWLIRASSPTSRQDSDDDSLAAVLADPGQRVVVVSTDVLFDDEPGSLAALVATEQADGRLSIVWPCPETVRADFERLARFTRREPNVELLVDLLQSIWGDGDLWDRFREHLDPAPSGVLASL